MVSDLKKYWNYGNSYCAIEHSSKLSAGTVINITTAKKRDGEFEPSKMVSVNEIAELSHILPKNQHCFLTISDNQVIIKASNTSGTIKAKIAAAFPNIDFNEFYYEILETSDNTFIAICRQEYIHELLKNYEAQNLEIVGFSLGFFPLQQLASQISSNEILTTKYLLKKTGNDISSFEKRSGEEIVTTYEIADISISSDFIISLSGLFAYENNSFTTASNFANKNSNLKKTQKQKVFFRKGLKIGTGILFLALVINFFLFSNYYEEFSKLNNTYRAEIINAEKLQQQKERISLKEKKVSNILENKKSNSSYFLNRTIATKPVTIILREFTYQPLNRAIKQDEPIEPIKDKIIITGESSNKKEFSSWIRKLEKISWIDKVEITEFSYLSPGKSNFNLTLKLREDDTPE